MKKVFVCVVIIFLLGLTACRGQSENLPQPGSWYGHVFVSDYFGLQFTMPEDWFYFTEDERAAIAGTPAESWSGFESPSEAVEVHDMRAANIVTGDDVLLRVQSFPSHLEEDLDAVSYLQNMSAMLQGMGIGARNFNIGVNTRQLGAYHWYYMTYLLFDDALQVMLVNIDGRFVRTVIATDSSGSMQGLMSIINNFAAIDSASRTAAAHPAPGYVSFGSWQGNIYQNPTLGINFTSLEGFRSYTTLELANDMGVPVHMVQGSYISEELWEEAFLFGSYVYVMVSYHEETYSSVEVSVRRMPRGMRRFPLEQYLARHIEEEAAMWESVGLSATTEIMPGTTRIGAHDWLSARVTVTFYDLTFIAERFTVAIDGNIWNIVVVADDLAELGMLLAQFE